MRCGAILVTGARCGRQAVGDGELCAFHRSLQVRREARAFRLALESAEDEQALGAAAAVQGIDYEIAILRVFLRRAVGAGGIEAVRRGIDTLCRALLARRRLGGGEELTFALEEDEGEDEVDLTHEDAEAVDENALAAAPPGVGAEPPSGPFDKLRAGSFDKLRAGSSPERGEMVFVGKGRVVPQEVQAADLALRYQRGEAGALEALYSLLEVATLAAALNYRGFQPPSGVSLEALQRESRVLLGQLAQEWRPGVSFLGYFSRAFPRALARFGRRAQVASRGAASVSGSSVPPSPGSVDALQAPAGSGACPPFSAEDLATLPEVEGRIVYLRACEGQDILGIARQVGVPVAMAYRLYQRALGQLGGRGRSPGEGVSPGMRRLVQALHAAAGRDGSLPSRDWAMAAAGLKRREYDQLIARLEGVQAIYGRSQRVPGHLVERDAAATLARLGDGKPGSRSRRGCSAIDRRP